MNKNLLLLLFIVVFCSCSKHNDLFDEGRHALEEAKKNFPVENVDPNHTWEMMCIRTLDVTINELPGAVYTIKVYTDNPFDVANNAKLLAQATMRDGETNNIKFDIPSTLNHVYVMRQINGNDCVLMLTKLKNDKFSVVFSNPVTPRAVTRASSITIADGIPTDIFTCPENAQKATAENLSSLGTGIYYTEEDITVDNVWLGNNVRLYIESGTLTVKNGFTGAYGLSSASIIISPKARLSCPGGSLQASQASIYNKGVIEIGTEELPLAETMSWSNTLVYNEGNMILYFDNGGIVSISGNKLINNGILSISSEKFEITGNAEFHNGANAQTRTIYTQMNDGKWVNDGTYTTETFEILAQGKLQNNCKLYVYSEGEGEFLFTSGGAIFNNEGYAKCDNATFDKSTLNLAASSVFQVDNTAKFSDNVTINGLTGPKPALLWMGEANSTGGNSQLNFNNNLDISCSHFFKGYEDETWYPSNRLISATINENITGCNAEYTKNEPTEESPFRCHYVFEDTRGEGSDFDYNDLVLEVTTPINGKAKANLLAAGAIKQLKIRLKNSSSDFNTLFEKEVHQLFGKNGMINTGQQKADIVSHEINVSNDFSLTNADFYIIDGTNEIHLPKHDPNFKPGGIPFSLCVPFDFQIAQEGVKITEKYPHFFEWATNQQDAPDWYRDSLQ